MDAGLVRALLADQHPDLADLLVEPLDSGWDNAIFRLGGSDTGLVARLPRRKIAAGLLEHEQDWLPELAPRLPVKVPAPVRVGVPGCGYPWRWSLLPWLPGETADLAPVDASEAERLADFLRALHAPAPAAAPRNPFRGVPLAQRRDVVEARLLRLSRTTDDLTDAIVATWEAALRAPEASRACWVHGDLHARNVLVLDGVISAVIDWGDVCRGDPATDLAAVWMLLDDPVARARAIDGYGPVTAGTWMRALGWAVSFGTVLLETGLADHPRHADMGRAILRRVAEGPNAADFS